MVRRQPLRAEGDKPAVQLHSGDDDHQDVGARVFLRNAVADQASQGPSDEHGQELETDDGLNKEHRKSAHKLLREQRATKETVESGRNPRKTRRKKTYQVSASPSPIGLRIDHPEAGEGVVAAGLGPVGAARLAEVVVGGRGEGERVGHGGQRQPRVEAVVEEAALEAEVDEGVEGVPDEQEALAGARRPPVQRQKRRAVRRG